MHVVFLPKYYPGRGDVQLGEFIRRHAQAVAALAQVSVVAVLKDTATATGYHEEISEEQGVWTLRAYYRPLVRGWTLWRTPLNFLRYRKAAERAWQRFLRERGQPLVCHVHVLTRPSLLAYKAKKELGIPYAITEHSSEFLDGHWLGRPWLNRWFTRRAFAKAGAVTVVSERLGRAIRDLGLVELYEVIPNVLPLERATVAERGPAHHAIMVADLVDRVKNITGVLECMALLRNDLPDLKLTIVGGGVDEQSLRQRSKGFNLEDRVTFLGQLSSEEAMQQMAKAGFLIVNSRYETFSVVTGEALMLGKPVIATRCGGPESFMDGHNGELIPVDNVPALADAVRRMVGGHHQYDPGRIRATVDERYSSAWIGQRFLTLYQRMLSDKA